ncbi:hypothetical protein [Streptomyces agglomeratus]|uniref:hypothetical protein n=1 Tax=Streptomyces agglomeratus TaxID=285458 RepID=UPI003B8A838E
MSDEEIDAAVDLMEAMAMDHIQGFRDHYQDALQELIAAKAEGMKLEGAEPSPAAAPVVDLMAALKESMEQARHARRQVDDGSVHDMAGHVERKAAKAPAKKPAKKTSRKSSV